MKKTALSCCALACILSASALAQEMPAPRKMPREPVKSEQTVAPAHEAMPASHELQGVPTIVDGEKMRMADYDLRLFGIVPPQLAASFGPQARAELDRLAGGQTVACHIRDRDHDGRLLATCRNAAGSDMALELLKRGLAVTARGSIANTELSAPYLAAEQAAEAQRLGLWSTATPPAAPAAVAAPIVAPAPKAESAPEPVAARSASIAPRVAPSGETAAQARLDNAIWSQNAHTGFFERYQILIAGLLTLVTASGIMGALWLQKSQDRNCEMRAIAAALRGELMAARGVCMGRIKSINDMSQDRAATWPRIRATLYQAYVGRLGLLGARMARQISSIYGQSSDYAALYNPASGSAPTDQPKRQALENLVRHIDEVLPELAEVERTGETPPARLPRSRYDAPVEARKEMPVEEAEQQPESIAASFEERAEYATPGTRRAPPALWEAVRDFIQTNRSAAATEQPQPEPEPGQSAEYAEIIEAEMARYRYPENVEKFDLGKKKSGF